MAQRYPQIPRRFLAPKAWDFAFHDPRLFQHIMTALGKKYGKIKAHYTYMNSQTFYLWNRP